MNLRERVRELYEGPSTGAQRFRYGLLIFDLTTILFVIATSFVERNALIQTVGIVFGVLIIADLAARLLIAERPFRLLIHPVTLADLVAIASFVAPVLGGEFAFLRVLRMLRLLHTYQLLKRLRGDFSFFRRNEQIFQASANLTVFIFVMTGIVFVSQNESNPQINNYADSLYFTITALTTTGFGDITLPGTEGRMIAIVIMFFGVTLFLRLAQVLFRPPKIKHRCEECGLLMHDPDAVHCKHCGETVEIETQGEF